MPAFAGAPSQCLCARLRAAARRLTAHYDAALAPHGLTLPQFGVMATIAAAGEIPMSALAAQMGLDPSTLSRTFKPLEHNGLVEIVPDPANRRLRIARLTRAGRQKVRDGGRAWAKAQKAASATIDEKALQALYRATERLEHA